MTMPKSPTRPAPRLTEFQRFARAARKAGMIVSKKAYDMYFRGRGNGSRAKPDKQAEG